MTDNNRLQKLTELCITHNESIRDCDPDSLIDLDKYTTEDELIFNLWKYKINIENLGFGYPYDELAHMLPDGRILGKPGYSRNEDFSTIDKNDCFLIYFKFHHLIPEFLYYSLLLPHHNRNYDEQLKSKFNRNIISLNEILSKINKENIKCYDDLRKMLRPNTLSKLDLCYLLWECENYNIYNEGLYPGDIIDVDCPRAPDGLIDPKIRTCYKCGYMARKMKMCAGCKNAHYCSIECQKGDRKNHKMWCKKSN